MKNPTETKGGGKKPAQSVEWWYPNMYWATDADQKEHLIVEIECCSGKVDIKVKNAGDIEHYETVLDNASADDLVCVFTYYEDHHGTPSIFRRVYPKVVKNNSGNSFHLLADYTYNKGGGDPVIGGKKRTRRSGTLVKNAKK